MLKQNAAASLQIVARSIADIIEIMPKTSILPERLGRRPMIVRKKTDLPLPEPPTKPENFAAADIERKMIEHDVVAETDDEIAYADDRLIEASMASHPDRGEENGEQAVENDDKKDRRHDGGCRL